MNDLRSRKPLLSWPVIYYLLAGFNLLVVSASLYLNYRVTDLYVQAVASGAEWGQILADFSAIEELAAEVNGAGNDVFESLDPVREGKRVRAALATQAERMAALQKDLLATVPSAEAPALRQGLREIETATRAMADQAETVFALFARGKRDDAARQMAAMDRRYAALLAQERELRVRFAQAHAPRPVRAPDPEPGTPALKEPRWQRFSRETNAAAALQRAEFVIAALVVVMVAAAIGYGRNISRRMEADAALRARHLAALQEARDTLEERVAERTAALLRSEESLRRAASEWLQTFEAIESPVLLLDAAGLVVRANRRACELVQGELVGRALATLGDGQPWAAAAQVLERMTRDAGASSLQVRDAHSRRTWDVAGNLLSGDDGPRAIVVARDITRLVELQETVGREERMAAMGSLVAGVAHEVRNPLFGISTTLAALAARLGENDAYAKYFAVLKNDVLRLKTLMQDLLDYGRPARLELRPTALPELLGEAVRSCRNVTRTLRVVLDLPESLPELPLDRLRMVQVFQNLIQNGLQHSPPGSAVTLQGGSADHAVWIAVQDQGPGFASEDLPRLFEPFFTRRQAGTGLGLSIAQQIVEQHGGTITARNRPEGGAEVRVNLPLVAA